MILKELDEINMDLEQAVIKFEDTAVSKEIAQTRVAQEEEQFAERLYWRMRISDETGIEILDEDEIYDKFCETLNEVYETALEHFQYDSGFLITHFEEPELNEDSVIFSIISNAEEDARLDVWVRMSIDDEIEDFVKELIGYVENELNPFIEQLQELEDAVKEGGPEPVADFPCEECGKYGVSILESFYPIGKCCYCGNENEVHVCALCGTVFNEWGGDEDICNGCMIDEERNEIE